jgi:hypothetical protein
MLIGLEETRISYSTSYTDYVSLSKQMIMR